MAGGTFFFTATLQDRGSNALVENVELLRAAFNAVKVEAPFTIDAIVILPDHLHTIWTLPEGDRNYSKRWRAIKSRFTRALVKQGVKLSKNGHGEYNLWQRRYWEHTIRDERDLNRHIDYIHYNPVKHGLVNRVREWPYSSFHRYVREGLVDIDWGSDVKEDATVNFGE